MAYLSKQEYEKRLANIRMENASIARKRSLKRERTKYSRKWKLPSTSKMLLWTVVLLCLEVLVFCEYVFIQTRDTSFIYALAGIPTVLVPAILSYNNKSMHENTEGGIVYETAMSKIETNGSSEAVG